MPHYTCRRCKKNFFREQVYLVLCQNCLGEMNLAMPISLGPYEDSEIEAFINGPTSNYPVPMTTSHGLHKKRNKQHLFILILDPWKASDFRTGRTKCGKNTYMSLLPSKDTDVKCKQCYRQGLQSNS